MRVSTQAGAFYVIIYPLTTPGAMKTDYAHKRSISITLDLEVYDDFDYKNIDFDSLLELEGDEHLEVSITDYSNVEVIWITLLLLLASNYY